MEIIFHRNKNIAGDFEEAFRASFPQITVCTSMKSFSSRLRHTPTLGVIIVSAAADEKELTMLMSIRHLFADAPTILLLPTKETSLLAKAHTLHPRFIGDLESNAKEVIAVIHKMLTPKAASKNATFDTALSDSTEKIMKGVKNGRHIAH